MRGPKCACSMCRRYLFSNNPEDVDYSDEQNKEVYFEERKYQTTLIEIAKRRNIIACLPTGSGKTFIALKLMEHYKDEIFGQNKKVFFLANTIPLVNQQAAFFARNSPFNVRHITGDMECDYWGQEKWETIIKGFNVIAMTAQIFLNIIRHAFIKFSDVVLLIFDECHHAANEHPMRNIMKEYDYVDKMEKDKDYRMPRILGLTATIIKGNCKTSEVPVKVRELESTMASTAVTYKDYEDVLKCSTSAKVHKEIVSNVSYEWDHFTDKLEEYSKELNEFRKRRKQANVAALVANGIDPTLKLVNNIYLCQRKPTPGDLKITVDDVRTTLQDLGTYCGYIALNLRLAFINFSLMDLADGEMKTWYLKIKSFFKSMRNELKSHMEVEIACSNGKQDYVDFVSPKLGFLIDLIAREFRNKEQRPVECVCENGDGDDNSMCGLVFTDRRVTAQVLAWYFIDLAKKDDFKFIRANFVVGSSRSPFETVESRIYAKKQTDTINKFRQKIFNILIATSVLEEGIDVPSCNLVVRFDTIRSYTSYIQSMGRARKTGALFYALLDAKTFINESSKLDNFQEINKAMVAHLVRSVEKIDQEDSALLSSYNIRNHNIAPFCPGGGPDSPRITVESGFEIVERYCMLLPCDGISTLSMVSWWDTAPGGFKAYLKLPINSIIKGTISGPVASLKELAKLLVHFEAAKLLHAEKGLDDNLIPVRPTIPEKVEAFFKFYIPIEVTADTGEAAVTLDKSSTVGKEKDAKAEAETTELSSRKSQIRKDWYQKTIPEIFRKKPLKIKDRYNVYRVSLDLTQPNANYAWKNLYNLGNAKFSFGIICAKEIPNVESFPLYGGFGRITVKLIRVPKYSIYLTDEIVNFQKMLFGEILHLQHPLLRTELEMSYAIVPLLLDTNQKWVLNEEIFAQLRSYNEVQNTRPEKEAARRGRAEQENRAPPQRRKNYDAAYSDTVVIPWYKGKERVMYTVDSVEAEMTPLSSHANFGSYKLFYHEQYKTKIFNNNQPLLKCKIAGVGKGMKQLNYLLEKYAKEDHFPVYLVPELCFKLPILASYFTQLKLLPSILHRLNRLLLSQEILVQVGFRSVDSGSAEQEMDLVRLTSIHGEKRQREEDRRLQREETRKKLKLLEKSIPEIVKKIEYQELHYEFIHPMLITKKKLRDFHTAVSDQHAAAKLTLPKVRACDLEDGELTTMSTIELLPFDEVNLRLFEPPADLGNNFGPSLLSIMEGITRLRSGDGVSNDRFSAIGRAFLNFAVSKYTYINFIEWNEPLMCQFRNRLLSLQYLNAIAKKKNLPEMLAGGDFFPSESWVPPGFHLPSYIGEIAAENQTHLGVYNPILDKIRHMTRDLVENFVKVAPKITPANPTTTANKALPPFVKFSAYTHAEVNDLEVSDCLSALVGVFFRDCGSSGAYQVLDWMGFVAPDLLGGEQTLNKLKPAEEEIQLADEHIRKLIPTLAAFEEKIGYSFKNKRLFIEAVTHPSFLANTVSECYQRLEFLGDAVLDVLLTTHIFSSPTLNRRTIDELREIRSALVNNVTFASLSVRYGLQKYLLSMSKPLLDMIDNFVVYQETVQHQVCGHFTLISDEECYGPKHIEVPKVLGDIFEAVAGAIYVDSGHSLDTVWKIFYRLMQNEIDMFTEVVPKCPLRELKEKFKDEGDIQFMKWTSVKLRSRGREMTKITIRPHGHYYGIGTTVARAREAAAKIALKMIKEEDTFMENRKLGEKIMLLI